jgi:Domain of unknown function (DUF6542)
MNEKPPDQANAAELALDQLRMLGELFSCLDAAGYDLNDTQQLHLMLAARLHPQAGRPIPVSEEADQALQTAPPDEALLDSLDTAALIARSSLGTPSARRIRSLTSASQIAEILRRRDLLATRAGILDQCLDERPKFKKMPSQAAAAGHATQPNPARPGAAQPAAAQRGPRSRESSGRSAGSRRPERRRPWGSLQGGFGVCLVVGSTALGAIATMVAHSAPGALLGFFVVASTVAAALAVHPRAGRLIFPVPALSYVIAALVIGIIYNPAADGTALAIDAAQWIANGFFAMALATVLAIVLTAVRWYLWRRRRSAARDPARQQAGEHMLRVRPQAGRETFGFPQDPSGTNPGRTGDHEDPGISQVPGDKSDPGSLRPSRRPGHPSTRHGAAG